MNGYQIMFWLIVVTGVIGYGMDIAKRHNLFMGNAHKRQATAPHAIRTWVAITETKKPEKKIPVLVKDTGKKELVSALRVIRDEPFTDYTKYSYNELLATVTPEEIEQLQSYKEFMK